MLAKELMTTDVATCRTHDDLATAARIMRDHHCGFVPVIDERGGGAGVATDRDVCVALAGAHQRAAEAMSIEGAMSRPVISCLVDENVKAVLATMAKHHVRRLTVLDRDGHLKGVLSIDDIVQAPYIRGGPIAEEIIAALKGIGERPRIDAAV